LTTETEYESYLTYRSKHGPLHLTAAVLYEANKLALCAGYLGDATPEGNFDESNCEGLCLGCLRAYLRGGDLRLVRIGTAGNS